jgi:hypothetical protein
MSFVRGGVIGGPLSLADVLELPAHPTSIPAVRDLFIGLVLFCKFINASLNIVVRAQ